MTNEERKEIVKKLLAEGRTLSEVQDYLHKEKGDSITYMELRLLLSEMPDIKLPEKEPLKPASAAMPPSALDAGAGPARRILGLRPYKRHRKRAASSRSAWIRSRSPVAY